MDATVPIADEIFGVGGLSWGWPVVIFILFGLSFYVVGGIAKATAQLSASPSVNPDKSAAGVAPLFRRHPHWAMWQNAAGLVLDGCAFSTAAVSATASRRASALYGLQQRLTPVVTTDGHVQSTAATGGRNRSGRRKSKAKKGTRQPRAKTREERQVEAADARVAALLEAEGGSSAASTAVGAPRPAHAMSGDIDFDSSGSDLSLNLPVTS